MSNCADVDRYIIVCREIYLCIRSYDLREETPSHSLNVTFYDPYSDGDRCSLSCYVYANNSAGNGPASRVEGRECI